MTVDIYFYNTLTKSKDKFEPINKEEDWQRNKDLSAKLECTHVGQRCIKMLQLEI